jgi:hypothetical protein
MLSLSSPAIKEINHIGMIPHAALQLHIRQLGNFMRPDFGQASCQRYAMDQKLESLPRTRPARSLGSRMHHRPGGPQMPTSHGQTVHDGRLRLLLPGAHRSRERTALAPL